MKKYLLIFMALLFIPMFVYAEECDPSKVYIESINLEKNNNVEEIVGAEANGKTISLNLSMSEVGNSVKYKIKLKNDSSDDYELDKNSVNISTDYVDYAIESEDNSNVIKAKSTKTVYLNVQYKHAVPSATYTDGTFNDNVTMKVNLSTDSGLLNPNTGISYIILILAIVFTAGILLIVFKKRKKAKALVIIISLLIIPFSVNALCKSDIKIESNVTINNSLVRMIEQDTEGIISVGDEVIIGGKEHFYVVSSDSEKTVLLAKYNLLVGYEVKYVNGEGYRLSGEISSSTPGYGYQSEKTTTKGYGVVPFSGKMYWQSNENPNTFNPNYPDARNASVYNSSLNTVTPNVSEYTNSNNYTKPVVAEGDYTIAYYVEPYIEKMKAMGLTVHNGGLLSNSQASSLGCSGNTSCSYYQNTWLTNTSFWVASVAWQGSASYQNCIKYIDKNRSYGFEEYNSVTSYGVKPTITINSSDIKLLPHDYFVNKPIVVQ